MLQSMSNEHHEESTDDVFGDGVSREAPSVTDSVSEGFVVSMDVGVCRGPFVCVEHDAGSRHVRCVDRTCSGVCVC